MNIYITFTTKKAKKKMEILIIDYTKTVKGLNPGVISKG